MNKTKSCLFYIIRHGETQWNVKGIMQGHQDSPLTKKGLHQAKLSAKLLKNIKFDAIYSSDLLRAKKTAEIIALEKKMIVKTNKLLREGFLGRFQGKKPAELRKELKTQFKKRNNLSKEKRFKFKMAPDIESDQEMISRFIIFLRELAIINPNKKILIVSHGGIMRAFLIHLGWAEYEELPPGSVKNTAQIIIESDGIDFFIKEVKEVIKNHHT